MNVKYPAVFARGGTSKALIFHRQDLPSDRVSWDEIFLKAMGSPDPYGRQLDGMGGGISSLSKVCVVGTSTHPEADVDYTFAQIQIRRGRVDYSGNCGNMVSAIGPFAVDEGLVKTADGDTCVRIHNTNTGKLIRASFVVAGGKSVNQGEMAIPGVSGTGPPVKLDFLDPGGASTGKLLPTDRVIDKLGDVDASLVDAANACVFIDAASVGLTGAELPDDLDSNPGVLQKLADLRERGSVAMGLSATLEMAHESPMVPLIALVSSPQPTVTLAGVHVAASEVDLVIRMISNGQPHRALPITGALCVAAASEIPGTVPNRLARKKKDGMTRIGMPSGVMDVSASVPGLKNREPWRVERASVYRTTRRLFAGEVYV